jgi:hypothetical protein
MALKVVPAGDERCDIHNNRRPPKYVCKSCLEELGIDSAGPATSRKRSVRSRARRAPRRLRRRIARRDRRILVGGAVALVVLAGVVIAVAAAGGGGGGGRTSARPTEGGVVNALQLLPDPNGAGWITPNGACWVVSIQFGADVRAGELAGKGLIEATNATHTVGAAVTQNDFTQTAAQCADRIAGQLKSNFP